MKCRLLYVMLLSLLLPAIPADAQQVKLRATLQVPASDPFFGVSLVHFKEEVARLSEKAISVEIFDKGQLYKDDQVVEAVSSAAIEMGIVGSNWVANKLPALGILEQPFLFNFDALVRAAVQPGGEIRKLIDEAVLASTGLRILWWQSLGNTIFVSKGGDAAEPERIKNRTVRVFSKTLAQFTTLCGGTPTMLSVAKLHDALDRGVIDMAMAGLAAFEARELWKVSDTITRTEHAPVEYFLVINEKVWQSLSQSQQAVLAQAATSVERQTRDRVAEIEARAYDFARSKNIKVQELTSDQVAEWRACSADVLTDYMAHNAELAQRLMAAYGRLRMDPCCSAGPGSTAPFTRR
jgi:C4-dicarboxylate-binding protein DctP